MSEMRLRLYLENANKGDEVAVDVYVNTIDQVNTVIDAFNSIITKKFSSEED